MRGRVCGLQQLLALASAVILGPNPLGLATIFYCRLCHSIQSHIVTDGQSISLSWCRDISSCLKVTVLSMWGALSDEKLSLTFVSHSR
jgi:hypothetical protein